jgi:hypothetical protein
VTAATFFGSISDPSGDTGVGNPDLVSAAISVTGADITVSVRFAAGTFSSSTTQVQFSLDTDQNAATGHPGTDSGCPTPGDNGVIGGEYIANMGSTVYGSQARVQPYAGVCNVFDAGALTTAGSVTYVADGMDVTFPLSLIGSDDGMLNFKVTTFTHLGGGGTTGIQDRMTDLGLPPGQVQ